MIKSYVKTKEINMASMSSEVRIGDQVYFMKRASDVPPGTSDNRGEWLSGSGRILSITTIKEERVIKGLNGVKVKNVASVRVMPYPSEKGDDDVLTLNVGEFTYSLKNFLLNLLA